MCCIAVSMGIGMVTCISTGSTICMSMVICMGMCTAVGIAIVKDKKTAWLKARFTLKMCKCPAK